MSLPTTRPRSQHCESAAPDFDLGVCAPLADEPPQDFEPSAEDYEWVRACDLASFLKPGLPFQDWLSEVARQIGLPNDPRYTWLSGKVDELAQLAVWTDAKDPATYDDRIEVYERELRDKSYHAGFVDGKRAAGGYDR